MTSSSLPHNKKVVVPSVPTATVPTTTATASSVGQAIQLASTAQELLEVASSLWLPTDANLAPHLQAQLVHHEKRQRWSAPLLEKLGTVHATFEEQNHNNDERLTRAILGASIPFEQDRLEKEGLYVHQALIGLHCLVGALPTIQLSADAMGGIRQLIDRSITMAPSMTLSKIVEARWAIRGLMARLDLMPVDLSDLDAFVSHLPFDILPCGLDWSNIIPKDKVLSTLREEIPFRFDTIVTRTGATVTERRATTWLAAPDIGALAYSGKLMTPRPIPPVIDAVSVWGSLVTVGNFIPCFIRFAHFLPLHIGWFPW